jgi:hypothetical protein
VVAMSDHETRKKPWLRLPVVAASSEYLVMGQLMRRNILAYKAPPNNKGYDLICIHPDPDHKSRQGEIDRLKIQVKSRYATDCDKSFPVKEISFDAFDFLIAVFLNIGNFKGKNDGSQGLCDVEFYTLPIEFVKKHHDRRFSWHKLRLKPIEREIAQFKNEQGFEQIAKVLGIPKPARSFRRDV